MLHLFLQSFEVVALDGVLASDRLSDAHRPRDIHAEDDRDVLCCVASDASVLNLGCCLNKVSNLKTLRDLFLSDHDHVFIVAELANPDLVAILLSDNTLLVEDALTARTDLGITCGHLTLVGQTVEGDLEDIGVELVSILVS